jgi:hypothetical protein
MFKKTMSVMNGKNKRLHIWDFFDKSLTFRQRISNERGSTAGWEYGRRRKGISVKFETACKYYVSCAYISRSI